MAFKSFSSPSATANQRTHAKTGGYGYANKKTKAHNECAVFGRKAPRPYQPLQPFQPHHEVRQALQALHTMHAIQMQQLMQELQDQQLLAVELQAQLLRIQGLNS